MAIYQLAHGRCSVEKNGVRLGVMTSGAMFGEISFLRTSKATASVKALTDITLYCIDGKQLYMLFVRLPAISGKFFHYLAVLLQQRLREREEESNNNKIKAN